MIEVENITKIFGTTLALDGISFAIETGGVVGLLGPNGAGKTTLMRILSCYLPATSGTARVSGFDVTKQPMAVRRNIGCFLEKVPLYSEMRVSSFLGFVAEIKGLKANGREKMIRRVMEQCGLDNVGQRIIGNLSKGYRQRVGLAQALLNDPKVLILDEPTIGLDPDQVYEIRNLIKNLSGDRTILLSSHILPEISQICGKVLILNKGRIVAIDTSERLGDYLQPSNRMKIQIEGPDADVEKELRGMSGFIKLETKEKVCDNMFNYIVETEKGVDFQQRLGVIICEKKWVIREIRPVEMSLEEIYRKIVCNN